MILSNVSNKWFSAKADFVLDSIVPSVFEVAHRWVVRSNKRQNPLIRLLFCVKADELATKLTLKETFL